MPGKRARTLAVGLLLALPMALSWALLSTGWGARTLWPYVEKRLPDGVSVDSISGRIRSPLGLYGVRVERDGLTARVERIAVVWSLGSLLWRTLRVGTVDAEGVTLGIRRADASSADAPPPLPTVSLPLATVVDRAAVRRISVTVDDDAPLELDSLDVRELHLRERFSVASLVGAAPQGHVRALGWVEPAGDYPLSVRLEVQGALGPWEPIEGSLSLSGRLTEVTVTAAVTRPLHAELSATVYEPRTAPRMEARIVVAELDAPAVRADLPQVRGRGTIDVSGWVDSLRLEASAEVETPQTGPVAMEGVLVRADSTLRIEELAATVRGARLRGSGTVTLAEASPALDLSVGGRGLRWPLEGPAEVRLDTAWVRVRGTADSYGLEGGARGTRVGGPSGRVTVRGTGTRERFAIADLRLNALDGSIQARGSVGWNPQPSWTLRLAVDDLDPGPLLPDSTPWPGAVNLRGRTAGRMADGATDGSFAVDTLRAAHPRGNVEGALAGTFQLPARQPDIESPLPSVHFDSLALVWGPNSLWAKGTVGDTLDLDLRLGAPDLGVLSTDFRGELEVTGSLAGSRSAPRVEGRIQGSGLGHVNRAIDALLLQVELDAEPGGVVAVEGRATGLTDGRTYADSVALDVRGTPGMHTVTGHLRGDQGALDLVAAGGMAEGAWAGMVQQFDFDVEPLGLWLLHDSVEVAVSSDEARVERGCWRSEGAQACVQGSWQERGAIAVTASVRELDMERFASSLPEGWTVRGTAAGDATVRISADSTLSVRAMADFGSGVLGHPVEGGRRELRYAGAVGEVVTDGAGTRADAAVYLSAEGAPTVAELVGHLNLPYYTRRGQPLDSQTVSGRLQASMRDFSALDALLTSVEDLAGEVDVDVLLSGTVMQPELEGEARLRGGSLDVPRLGLELRGAEMTAVGMGREGFAVQGEARSGGGSVQLSGTVPAVPSASDPMRLQISGAQFQAVDVPEVSVWISPALELLAVPGRIDLTGSVLVPRARVELTEMSAAGISPSPDIVFVDDTAAARARGPEIYADVRITLGDSVAFRGFGLTAQPQGSILASDAPGRATTATGEITITGGRYRAYGQSLTIERGRAVYAGGPVNNPGLDIRATRRARDGVVAGLEVRGTLLRPDATLFSEPAMLQSDALAYLVLGRPLGSASSSEGSLVANAATSLGIRGGNALAGRIAQRFGLEEIRIQAEGPLDAASLIAGKYLSPRLYVSYGVGLFEPINTFRMRYQLSRLWTLQAETGRAAGADLMYRIERGR